jgi:hypothetical protein
MLMHPAFLPELDEDGPDSGSQTVRLCKWLSDEGLSVVERARSMYKRKVNDPT